MAIPHSFQKSFNDQAKESNFPSGFSNTSVYESKKVSFPRNHNPQMDSARFLEPEIVGLNQERKRRCYEKMVVGKERVDAKCGFEVDFIDDTALIEATGSVSGVKKTKTKKKKNMVCKKRDSKCSMKGVNEKKFDGGVGEDRVGIEKKVTVGKSQKGDGRVVEERVVIEKKKVSVKFGKVKAVYRRKDDVKIPELVETGVEDKNVNEKIVQETEVSLNVSNEVVQEKESTVELVETETVNEKDDIEVCTIVGENMTVESKKIVYSRGELEALRFVNGEGQKSKWIEVYGAFSPLVAKEYVGLVVDVNNRLTQRYNNRAVNCGSGYTRLAGNAILSMPPVLPMSSSLAYRKFTPYDRVCFGANYY